MDGISWSILHLRNLFLNLSQYLKVTGNSILCHLQYNNGNLHKYHLIDNFIVTLIWKGYYFSHFCFYACKSRYFRWNNNLCFKTIGKKISWLAGSSIDDIWLSRLAGRMITTKSNRMSFSSLNSTNSSLFAIGYILYFLVRRDWYTEFLYPITLGVFIVNIILVVYSLTLLKDENRNASGLKNRGINIYLKLIANIGFVILMLI